MKLTITRINMIQEICYAFGVITPEGHSSFGYHKYVFGVKNKEVLPKYFFSINDIYYAYRLDNKKLTSYDWAKIKDIYELASAYNLTRHYCMLLTKYNINSITMDSKMFEKGVIHIECNHNNQLKKLYIDGEVAIDFDLCYIPIGLERIQSISALLMEFFLDKRLS